MNGDDKDLEILKAKRLAEMQKNLSQKQKQEELKNQFEKKRKEIPKPRDILIKHLGYRGKEVLENAEQQFPEQTKLIVGKIAELISTGEINEVIDGGELLLLFRSVGLNVRVHTSINVQKDGKFVSLSDKLTNKSKENH